MADVTKLSQPALLADQVFANIRQSILDGRLPAGTRLRMRVLADQLGTSITPVREALHRLEEAGLAQREPHKGAVVRELSLRELVDVYTVRTLLEREAARLGAAAATPEDCERMGRELDALWSAADRGDVLAYLDHDEALLTILYASGGNPVLVRTIATLWRQCRAYKVVGTRDLESDRATRHQRDLVDAARANNAAEAAAITERSLADASRRIERELSGRR